MTTTTPEPEIGTGKTIFVIAVVLGCFAVLYPKIFYHMMFDEKKDKPTGKQKLNNIFFFTKLKSFKMFLKIPFKHTKNHTSI